MREQKSDSEMSDAKFTNDFIAKIEECFAKGGFLSKSPNSVTAHSLFVEYTVHRE